MRYVLCLLIALAGCVVTIPSDPTITADLACETARATLARRAEFAPAPPPAPAGKCTNCLGTGKIGDGRIVFDCPACKGTGKACKDGACRK